MTRRVRVAVLVAGVAVLGASGVLVFRALGGRPLPEAPGLRAFVRARPAVAVVFTSRSEPTAFDAPAPEADGFAHPGTIPWAAREGRLRLLDTDGKVYELTWGRELPGGGTLVDVLSPSVALDGTRVLFAGRRAAPDPGRWRLYALDLRTGTISQLTGTGVDPGCVAVPPLRFAPDGSKLTDDARRALDYDDVDPADRGGGAVLFASSRVPDLGRDHSRRSTQIWLRTAAGEYRAVSANRNNDRWPVLARGEWILWSTWSRNREAVTADGREVRPVSEGGAFATEPTDHWFAARTFPDGMHFGYAVKCPEPVWRPRPLFNGTVAFMTPAPGGGLRLAQAPVGYLRSAPSARAGGGPLPSAGGPGLAFGPARDAGGRALTAGHPAPCPPAGVLFAAAPLGAPPGAFALYRTDEAWGANPVPDLLFDDPALVDAEPVAVYARDIETGTHEQPEAVPPADANRTLISGRAHTGGLGLTEAHFLNLPPEHPAPGLTAPGGSVIGNPTGVTAVAVYGAHRDRFDHPTEPRVKGAWEKLLVAPLNADGEMKAWVPADPLVPTVIAGLGADGTVFRWAAPGAPPGTEPATFYAYAGDHYSGTRANRYTFCNGCHTGHTFLAHDYAERRR